ncbi:MAG: hypothetical protein GXO79_11475 [Chlorobi bacterium]|nr:hypothetical protein [Chlorobiota bacterium]
MVKYLTFKNKKILPLSIVFVYMEFIMLINSYYFSMLITLGIYSLIMVFLTNPKPEEEENNNNIYKG